jgi:hypothetical protein
MIKKININLPLVRKARYSSVFTAPPLFTQPTTNEYICMDMSCTRFYKWDKNVGNTGEISFKPFTVPIFPKLTSG